MNERRQSEYDEMTKDVTTTVTGHDGYENLVVNPMDYDKLAIKYHAQQEEIERLRGALDLWNKSFKCCLEGGLNIDEKYFTCLNKRYCDAQKALAKPDEVKS